MLKLPLSELGSVVGQQSHGTTMVMDALQRLCREAAAAAAAPTSTPPPPTAAAAAAAGGGGGDGQQRQQQNSGHYLGGVLSLDAVPEFSAVLLDAMLNSGRELNRRVSLGRATIVLHPFLIAWTQRNV